MTLDEYQDNCISTAIYPPQVGLLYTSLGLCSEAGEVADKIKKSIRDKAGDLDQNDLDGLAKELGDVLWYVAAMANELDMSLGEIADKNLSKLRSRAERDVLTGSGDDR